MATQATKAPTTKRKAIHVGRDPLPPDFKPDSGLQIPKLFLNRELTWLNFTRRVLFEAEDKRNPLLERVKFLSIASSNMDEFFMKRLGGLKQLIAARINERSVDGRTPKEQIVECYQAIREIGEAKGKILSGLVIELKQHGIELCSHAELSDLEKENLRAYYYQNIFPLVTPQGIDPAHPFPFISNLSLNLLVNLKESRRSEATVARVKIPVGPGIDRFVRVENSHKYVPLEDVITANIDLLFPGLEILGCDLFRVTRNANTEKNEEQADDLLELIEEELKDRKFAPIVRLQVMKGISQENFEFLAQNLELEPEEVFETQTIQAKRDLMEIATLDFASLHDLVFHPIDHPRLKNQGNFFENLSSQGPVLVYHPYESFVTSVERFLAEASEDPMVRAIKMTLYRTGSDSRVIKYLLEAAQNGKQVAVVLELKARFDEANNIYWANLLEEVGIHVTYGVVGLKTHAKIIQVFRMEKDGLKRYTHLGTGNYHAGTARLYSDFGYFTDDKVLGADITELLNYLTTGLNPKRHYEKILVAPSEMKRELINKIRRESTFAKDGKKSRIMFKTNALEDVDITRELYAASQAGVKVQLIVRDSCRLRPGVEGLSENITVKSIIGRFLEHSRVFSFENGGNPEYYMGSADAMQRNLESRVEVLVPIEDKDMQQELKTILQVHWADTSLGWEMKSDGSYHKTIGPNRMKSSQQWLMDTAEKRSKASGKLKQIHSRGKSKKEQWAGY